MRRSARGLTFVDPLGVDDETIANTFARHYAETKSIADAFRMTEAAIRNPEREASSIPPLVFSASRYHNVPACEILGDALDQQACIARMEVWWRLRHGPVPMSFPGIASAFGRDHSTVIHGVRRFERLLATRNDLRWRVGLPALADRQAA